MFFRSNRGAFPLLPPYGAHVPGAGQGRATPLHPDGITPYLGLRARLSQVWINRWTILLLLVLARCLLAVASFKTDMAHAKNEAMSACTSVEDMGSAMASLPYYMAQGVNQLTAQGVNDAVNGLMSMLSLSVTGVEEIVIFVLKMMYSTYHCLIVLAVRGSVETAVSLIEDATSFINKTIDNIATDITNTANTFDSDLNKFLSAVNSVASVSGGGSKKPPKLDLTSSLDALRSIQFPSSIDTTLNTLNSSLPTFDQVENFIEGLIKTPFEDIKKLINESLSTYHFDSSVLPVPQRKQLTFCGANDGIDKFFQDIGSILNTAEKVFIGVLTLAAVLACIPATWREIRRWRKMKERSQLVRKDAHDPLDVVYIVSRPYTAGAGIKAASRFSNSRRQVLVRWAVAYATAEPALFVLSLGIAGLFSALGQYLLVRSADAVVPELTHEVTQFADLVVSSLNNASAEWANGANSAILTIDHDINHNILGWVNTSTTTLNNTLNAFINETTSVLNQTFGGTILYQPVLGVFNCLIGLKVLGLEKGLTWVHDHAHVTMPLLPNNTFSVGAAASITGNNSNPSNGFLTTSGSVSSNKVSAVVVNFIDKILHGIATEAIIACVLVLIWVLIAALGALRSLTLFWARDKHRGEGGGSSSAEYLPADEHAAYSGIPLTATATAADFVGIAAAAAPSTRSKRDGRQQQSQLDEKFGFAGHRTLKVRGVEAGSSRGSSYVEYGDEKATSSR